MQKIPHHKIRSGAENNYFFVALFQELILFNARPPGFKK